MHRSLLDLLCSVSICVSIENNTQDFNVSKFDYAAAILVVLKISGEILCEKFFKGSVARSQHPL